MIPEVPIRLQHRVEKMGGLAANGKPLFRVMRGCDRLTIIGGKWKKFDDSGNETGEWIGTQSVRKYPGTNERYIFEMLCPPENYGTPEEWDKHFRQNIDGQWVDTLGDFPRTGEYELVKVLETPNRRLFVPLTEAICDALVVTCKLNSELPERIKREAARERREKEEIARQSRLVDMINDLQRKGPSVAVPNMEEREVYGK